MADRRNVRVSCALIVLAMIIMVLPGRGTPQFTVAVVLFLAGIGVFIWQPKLRRRQRSQQ